MSFRPVDHWNGELASALQSALRMTNEGFAEHLGVGVRTVAEWHRSPRITPMKWVQSVLDTALEQAAEHDRQRFTDIASIGRPPVAVVPAVPPPDRGMTVLALEVELLKARLDQMQQEMVELRRTVPSFVRRDQLAAIQAGKSR
ncbi:hypothetical protein [Streptantibioticus silvisoli]|uniref:XRE family transcriptional regulator n=1 Tax=Streptantibioticus silvisoli TaxID=2705255 RepID=A0ABT6W266_9ACTN|nr:hypothetical protein [Streptantibioticus silvisoli]MDI5964837.1 hypothetical protein [Streptantibioticus silvisoli]